MQPELLQEFFNASIGQDSCSSGCTSGGIKNSIQNDKQVFRLL